MKKFLSLFTAVVLFMAPAYPDILYGPITGPTATVKALNPKIVHLTRIVMAESIGEPDKGKMWVAQTVINRSINRNQSIYEVISDKGKFNGYNNNIYRSDLDTSIYKLCKFVYELDNPLHNYNYFLSPVTSTNKSWKDLAMTKKGRMVGNHYFFNL